MSTTTNRALAVVTMALLVSLGVNVMPEDTHFCRDWHDDGYDSTMKCARLSGSALTCYPELNTTLGGKRCKTGWEPITIEKEPLGGIVFDTTGVTEVNCEENDYVRVCVGRKGGN